MKAVRKRHHSSDDGREGQEPTAPSPASGSTAAARAAAARDSDVAFRVSLGRFEQPALDLEEFYRESLEDLLQVVRLYFKGKPVLIDSFAFINRPDRQIPVLREGDHKGHDPRTAERRRDSAE